MSDVTPDRARSQRDPAAEELAKRINRLSEPYRSNAIAWLERWAGVEIGDLERDLPILFDKLPTGPMELWEELLGGVLEEAVRYFGAD